MTIQHAPIVPFTDGPALDAVVARLPRPLVFTNGVFDLFHAGHADGLAQARNLGAALVVGLNSDASAGRQHKGPSRPLVGQDDRAALLAALRSVDAVVLFDDDAPLAVLQRLRPDIYTKGDDRALADIPEADLVAGWGCRVELLPRTRGLSSSLLVQRAQQMGALEPE